MRVFLLAAALAALAATASAQSSTTTVQSTPVVIHSGDVADGAIGGDPQIILRQRVTTVRAAVLDEPAARVAGNGRQREGFPAGENLFGIYDGTGGWAYCALRESFWTGDALTCYQDTDNDQHFDVAKPSGAPFLGIPFFTLVQNGEARQLAAPVAFHRINYAEGPSIEAGLRVTLTPARTRRGQVTPARVDVNFGYIVENDRFIPVQGNQGHHAFDNDEPFTLTVAGARVEFSGPPVPGELLFHVAEPIPAHIERVTMTQIYTQSYTYVPIYIPR